MGGSSGGGGHTPKEAPESGRSKQLVKIIEVISEGEVQGLVDGVKTVFLDNTPIQNADNSYNFSNVEAQGRIGTQDQTILDGFNTTEKEVSVGTEVKKTTPLTRTITDAQVNRIRLTLGVSSLFKQEDNGDTNGSSVDLKITVGKQVYTVNFNGKYSSQFLKNIIIDNLPAVPFTIKVERVQADSTSQRLQNKTLWASYTEIIDTQFAYPNTALVGIKFDSEYFSQIPNRTYEIYGIKVKVPSNYDPTTRAYTGLWDGTFKIAYSDNPAWVLMDIVTNKRYGLGQRLGEFGVDKWALYQVAQYCDQLVPDGFGNQEPRFTCNVWLTEQRSAYDVINDICSIFRAMPVWNGTELTVIMDRPADPVWTYTNANVIGGFSRQYSAMKARHNAVQVEYQDKANSYQTAIEYVSNDDSIRKYGLNLKKVKAFGCTSRGQAYRTGRWILETEQLETETITFTVGAEGLMHIPGDIIRVADTQYAGANIGGRVQAINGRNVTLDREIEINGNSYFQYFNANAKATQIKISSVKGNIITLDSEPRGLTVMGVWSLAAANITARLYRAMGISENDDGSYTITALQHEPQKESIVDNGASFETTSTTLHNFPKLEHLDVGINGDKISFNWQTTSGVGTLSYDIKILKAGKLYRLEKGLSSSEFSLDDLPNGDYEVIIIAKNASGQVVSEKSQPFTIDKPPAPTNVRVTGGLSDITIEWDSINEFTQTEIFVSETNQLSSAVKLTKVFARTYVHNVGAKQTRYYWVRHIRGINIGPFYQEQGLKGESGVDIDAELEVLNQKLSENIVNDVIDTALPARGLELVKTVSEIPSAHNGYSTLYNLADGKQYVWNGVEYTADSNEILARAIKGTIQANQIAKIPTQQLVGTIQAEQISANSIGANAIQTNAINSDKIQANSITSSKISTGAIRANHIASEQITTDKLASNSVTAEKLVAGSVISEKIGANAITANKIVAGAINANHIATKSINSSHIVTKSLSADLLNVSSLSAISANLGTVTAGRITGTTIEGNSIKGNNISGGSININNNFIVDEKGNMTANSGIFKGAVMADKIIGDVVKIYTSQLNDEKYTSIIIPPSSRTILAVIIPIMCIAIGTDGYSYDRGNDKTGYVKAKPATTEIRLYLNNTEIASAVAYTPNSRPDIKQLSGAFIIDPNITATITFSNKGTPANFIHLLTQYI